MIRRRLRIGGMIEIPVGIFLRELRVFGLRPCCFGFRWWRSGPFFGSRGHSNRGANVGIVLASAHQITEREDNPEDYHEHQKQSDQVPALQYEIAAAFFPI